MDKIKPYLYTSLAAYGLICAVYFTVGSFHPMVSAPHAGEAIPIETNWLKEFFSGAMVKAGVFIAPLLIPLFGLFVDKNILYAPGTDYIKLKKDIVTKIRLHLETILKTESAPKDDINLAKKDIKELASHLLSLKTDLENRYFIRYWFSIPNQESLDEAFKRLDQLDTICGGKDINEELEQTTVIHYARCIRTIELRLKIVIDPMIKDKWRTHIQMRNAAKNRRLRHADEVRKAGIRNEEILRSDLDVLAGPSFDLTRFSIGPKTQEQFEKMQRDVLSFTNSEQSLEISRQLEATKKTMEKVLGPTVNELDKIKTEMSKIVMPTAIPPRDLGK